MKTYTPEIIEQAKSVVFFSKELGKNITVGEWLKTLLISFILGENTLNKSGWLYDPHLALIRAGFLGEGLLNENCVIERYEEDFTPLFFAIVSSFK